MPKLLTEVDKLIEEVAELHFELMELRHKQTKVALAERRLRYLASVTPTGGAGHGQ